MIVRRSFDDTLNAALDKMTAGRDVSSVLAAHADLESALRPLLEVALRTVTDAPSVPEPTQLGSRFSTVRAAIRNQRENAGSNVTGWWQRRWTIASVSLSTSALAAYAIIGTGGAAAATVAISQPEAVSHVADIVTPDWVEDFVAPASHNDQGDVRPEPQQSPPGEAEATPAGVPALVPDPEIVTPERGASVTVTGTITVVNGNTFTLITADGPYHVVRNSKTALSGEIVEGAPATVTGILTVSHIHADTITVDIANAGPAQADEKKDAKTATPAPESDAEPASSIEQKTPAHTVTTASQPGGHGNAGGNGNGNGSPPGAGQTPGPAEGGSNGNGGGNDKTPKP